MLEDSEVDFASDPLMCFGLLEYFSFEEQSAAKLPCLCGVFFHFFSKQPVKQLLV